MNRSITGQSYKNYPAIENHRYLVLFSLVLFITINCRPSYGQPWDKLFNGKNLKGWDTYLGPPYDSVSRKFAGSPPGLNKDVSKVFSVATVDGRPAIRVSGEHFGGISTVGEFRNFHFRISFKWGQTKYHPKKGDKRDSGVLYHAVGDHGADGGFWMRSQEFQVQEGDCGDYWGVAGGSFEIRAKKVGNDFIYSADGVPYVFNEKSPTGRRCIKKNDRERKYGEWNTLEILCVGDTAVHIMNGEVVMVLTKSSQLDGEVLKPLVGGKIQIQSEGAEIFYRDAEIRPLASIPDKYFTD